MYKKILLVTIFCLLGFVRLYKLGSVPPGLYVDEAVEGYNAWSISMTGADEYGMRLPIFLRSFGAFSASLYVYISAGIIRLIGLSNFSVRLLSALSGIGLMIAIFLILKEIKFDFRQRVIAIILAGLSPWMLMMSRTGTEGHLSLMLVSFAALLALRATKLNYSWLGFFGLLGLASYAYQGARPIALGYIILFTIWKKSFIGKRWTIGLCVFVLMLVPQVMLMRLPAFSQRGIGLFYMDEVMRSAKTKTLPVALLYEFSSQASSYFSPYSLFWRGDEDLQRSMPGVSHFVSIFFIFYLLGWAAFYKKIKTDQGKLFIILSIIGVSVPALTKDPFSATRGQFLILPITIMMIWGYSLLAEVIGKNKSVLIFILMNLWSLVWIWRSLFILLPYERGYIWGYGIKKLAGEISSRPSETFLVEQKRQAPMYIQLLYELRFPPTLYQATQSTNGYYTDTNYDLDRTFGNVKVGNIEWKKDIYKEQIMVGDELSISEGQAKEHFMDKVFEIKDPLGKILFVGYRTNPSKKKIAEKILLLK